MCQMYIRISIEKKRSASPDNNFKKKTRFDFSILTIRSKNTEVQYQLGIETQSKSFSSKLIKMLDEICDRMEKKEKEVEKKQEEEEGNEKEQVEEELNIPDVNISDKGAWTIHYYICEKLKLIENNPNFAHCYEEAMKDTNKCEVLENV